MNCFYYIMLDVSWIKGFWHMLRVCLRINFKCPTAEMNTCLFIRNYRCEKQKLMIDFDATHDYHRKYISSLFIQTMTWRTSKLKDLRRSCRQVQGRCKKINNWDFDDSTKRANARERKPCLSCINALCGIRKLYIICPFVSTLDGSIA